MRTAVRSGIAAPATEPSRLPDETATLADRSDACLTQAYGPTGALSAITMGRNQTDMQTRLGELEATVRGLTQELVEANERIRQLEAAVEGEPVNGDATGASGQVDLSQVQPDVGPAATDGGDSTDDGGTKQMGGDGEADGEADSELDDIIVA